MSRKKKHYLITLCLDPGTNLHGYVMTTDESKLMAVAEKMVEVANDSGVWRVPIILQTQLNTVKDVDAVRGIVCALSEEARDAIATAKDFHMSVFAMSVDQPDDKYLMDLH